MKISTNFFKGWIAPWREYVSEFIGVSLFVFLASSVVVSQSIVGEANIVVLSLGIGFSYVCALYVTGHVSLGFLNPAVVVSLWLVKRIEAAKAVFYLISQVLGSFVGAILVWAVFGQRSLTVHYGGPMPGLGVGVEGLLAVEIIMSAILVFFVFALSVAKTAPSIFGPLVFGFFTTVATIIAYPISGASLNVVRVIGPLIFSLEFQYLFVYIIAGLVGSLSGLLYEYVFLRKGKK